MWPRRRRSSTSGRAVARQQFRFGWRSDPSRLTLVEAKTRKAVFLVEALRHLEIADGSVETARFEQLLTRPELHEAFDLLSIRAVRVEARTLLTLQAFLRPGGRLLWFRGPGGPDIPSEASSPSHGLPRIHLSKASEAGWLSSRSRAIRGGRRPSVPRGTVKPGRSGRSGRSGRAGRSGRSGRRSGRSGRTGRAGRPSKVAMFHVEHPTA